MAHRFKITIQTLFSEGFCYFLYSESSVATIVLVKFNEASFKAFRIVVWIFRVVTLIFVFTSHEQNVNKAVSVIIAYRDTCKIIFIMCLVESVIFY